MTDLNLDAIDPRKATPGQVADLIALVRAKESWIDGAKVDMAALEEDAAKATTWHMAALDDLATCVAERDEARAEVERLMQEVERLHNAVRDIDAAYLVARAQDRADGGYRDGYCDGLEHAERIMRGN